MYVYIYKKYPKYNNLPVASKHQKARTRRKMSKGALNPGVSQQVPTRIKRAMTLHKHKPCASWSIQGLTLFLRFFTILNTPSDEAVNSAKLVSTKS